MSECLYKGDVAPKVAAANKSSSKFWDTWSKNQLCVQPKFPAIGEPRRTGPLNFDSIRDARKEKAETNGKTRFFMAISKIHCILGLEGGF